MSGEVWTLAYFLKEATTVWRGPCRQAVPCPLLYPMVVTIFYYWHIMLSRPQVGTRKCWRSVGWPQWLSSISWSVLGPTMCLMWWGFSRRSQSWQECTLLLDALNAYVDPLIFYFSSSAVHKVFDKSLQRPQSLVALLSGCRRRRVREPAAERGNGSLGTANVSFIGD